jgi:DNA replication protein DnaC
MGVRECGCVKARKAEALLKKSGLAEALEQQTFETFESSTEMQKQIKDTARRYLETLFSMPADAPRKPWLYIGGNPGSGKTHICTAVCGKLLKANVEVVYMQWLTETRRLKAFVNEPDFEGMMDRFVDCDVLYIDDLFKQTYRGAPILTDADVRMAFTVFNERYLQNKPTIISSEWSLKSLLEADEGVFSRVYERCKAFYVDIPRDMQYNYRLFREKGA